MKKKFHYILLFFILLVSNIVDAQTVYDYNKSGIEKYKIGDYKGAIEDYTKAIKLASDTIGLNIIKKVPLQIACGDAYTSRGNAKSQLKDYTGAIQDYNKAIELIKDENTYYNRGIAKGNLGDFRGAIQDFDKVIELTPKFADAYNIRGLAKAQLGNMDGACLDWSKAGELGYSKAYDMIKEYCK